MLFGLTRRGDPIGVGTQKKHGHFITWFLFAIYLHTRITKGLQGKKPAIIASVGFVVIWICFLGVNLASQGTSHLRLVTIKKNAINFEFLFTFRILFVQFYKITCLKRMLGVKIICFCVHFS